MSRTVVLIPARWGSRRFPGKALVEIRGKTLIRWVWESVEGWERYVLTDDVRIRDCVDGFGGKALMTSAECGNGTERCAEGAKILRLNEGDVVINLQGDNFSYPQEALKQVEKDAVLGVASVYCKSVFWNPDRDVVKVVVNSQGRALYFSREPISYFKHVGIYGYRVRQLEEYMECGSCSLERNENIEVMRFLDMGIPVLMSMVGSDSVEINSPEDVGKALAA